MAYIYAILHECFSLIMSVNNYIHANSKLINNYVWLQLDFCVVRSLLRYDSIDGSFFSLTHV